MTVWNLLRARATRLLLLNKSKVRTLAPAYSIIAGISSICWGLTPISLNSRFIYSTLSSFSYRSAYSITSLILSRLLKLGFLNTSVTCLKCSDLFSLHAISYSTSLTSKRDLPFIVLSNSDVSVTCLLTFPAIWENSGYPSMNFFMSSMLSILLVR